MARFSNPAGSGDGVELPQGLSTDSSPTFDLIYTTHNSDGTNVKIGDDAWIGDVDTANHIAIIGVEDDTKGGIIFGINETETIASDGTNLTVTADNDIVLNPGSNYAYIGTPQLDGSNRIAKMSDITGGTDNHGNFVFQDSNLSVYDSNMQLRAYGADEVTLRAEVGLNPGSDTARFRMYDDQTSQSFSTSNWATATWTSTGETSSQLVLTGASGIFDYLNTSLRNFNQAISINGNTPGKLDGWGGNGTDITIYILDMPVGTNTTVTTLDVYSAFASTILLDYDDNQMNFDAQNMHINMTTTGNRDINIISADDATIRANGDDLNLQAGDDIRFTSNYNNLSQNWTMDSEGKFQLPGQGYIENPVDSSGDGNGYDTLKLVPDAAREEFDQYLIVDPTTPNHIHIRAGGTIDASTADLVLGGEETNVTISDSIDAVFLNGSGGQYLNSFSSDNQIATIGDVNAARLDASASFFSTVDQGPNSANAIQAFTFSNTDWATGITIGSTTQITMTNAGKYNIAFSAQMHQTNGSGVVNIWLNKNGTPLANSNTKFAITANNPYSVAALNLFVDAAAGDYYELMWSSDSEHTVMEYEAATGSGATLHPAVPSIILTVNQVG